MQIRTIRGSAPERGRAKGLNCNLVTSKVQPRVLSGTVGEFFLVNPQVGPCTGTLVRGMPCPGIQFCTL